MQSSDNETDVSDTYLRSYEKFVHENQVLDGISNNGTQQMVNQTILDKLEKISSRSDTREVVKISSRIKNQKQNY